MESTETTRSSLSPNPAPPRSRRPGTPGQGAGRKTQRRKQVRPGRLDSGSPVGGQPHQPRRPHPSGAAKTHDPQRCTNPKTQRRQKGRQAPPPANKTSSPAPTRRSPRPCRDGGATARTAPPPPPNQRERPHLPRSGGLKSRRYRSHRPGGSRGALWGLESSRGLCTPQRPSGDYASHNAPRPCHRHAPSRRLRNAPKLHFPTTAAPLPPSLPRHEPNWASGRGAGRVPARRCRRRRRHPVPLRDSPASAAARAAGELHR